MTRYAHPHQALCHFCVAGPGNRGGDARVCPLVHRARLGGVRRAPATCRDHRIVSARTIGSHIKKLRRQLGQRPPGRDLVHSVYGVGYRYGE
ncbi:MAG: hypothetical protein GKR94_34065 [Gammaproteobacteria bacterium]|nr:hypothetical protein [Gammaproteobacteria bacterium]